MAPPSVVPTPRTTTRSRTTPQSPASAPATRVTRLRAAKESAASTPTTSALPKPGATGFLAKGKAELRKVSDKLKEKEREREVGVVGSRAAAGTGNVNEHRRVVLTRITGSKGGRKEGSSSGRGQHLHPATSGFPAYPTVSNGQRAPVPTIPRAPGRQERCYEPAS